MSQDKRKKALWYVAATVGLAVSLVAWRADSQAVLADQLSTALPVSAGLFVHVHEIENRKTRVVVVDPQTRTMGIYDIGREDGEIQLKSVRKISADLQMLDFNSQEPSPAEIQSRLDQR